MGSFFVACTLGCTLLVSPAQAKEDSRHRGPAQRGNDAALGKAHLGIGGPSYTTKKSYKASELKDDTRFDVRARKSKNKTKATDANPYSEAMQALQTTAASIAPELTARGEVSFVVGKNGNATKARVWGLSPEVDPVLTQKLATLSFPKKDAGQYYVAKLTVIAQKPAPKAKAKRKRGRKQAKR